LLAPAIELQLVPWSRVRLTPRFWFIFGQIAVGPFG
jgi:hypothetical protein